MTWGLCQADRQFSHLLLHQMSAMVWHAPISLQLRPVDFSEDAANHLLLHRLALAVYGNHNHGWYQEFGDNLAFGYMQSDRRGKTIREGRRI